MDYGRAIKKVRAVRGISQKKLAKLAELDASYISMIENGHRIPSIEALESLSKALDVPMYLIPLLGSDPEDLRGGIPASEAESLADNLLQLVVNGAADEKS
jgi:transcriptional regulator with XRE-family HTH domain